MELKKKDIRMQRRSCKNELQITLEDDFNVPDSKPDVERIVTEEGRIEIVETNLLNGKLLVKGILHFDMLYISHENEIPVHSIQGKIEFDEMINMDELQEKNECKVKWKLEDINISLINSRKISVKSLVTLEACAWEKYEEPVVIDKEEDIHTPCRYKEMGVTELVITKKDILRIKENFHLPAGKPNINQILYYDILLHGVEMRAQEGKITVRGEMLLFVMYSTQEENSKIVYYEAEQPFFNDISCEDCRENMILQMDTELQSKDVQVKQDEDGEERGMEAEFAMNLDFSLYKDKQLRYLQDMYSLQNQLELKRRKISFRHLVMKSTSQKRINEQVLLETPKNPILQIVHSRGEMQLDEITWKDTGISLEGSIEIRSLYQGEQTEWPIGEIKFSVPFSYEIEGVGQKENKTFEIQPQLEQLSVVLIGGDKVEVKVLVSLETVVFERIEYDMLESVEEGKYDEKYMEQLPDMVGYRVQPQEDMWDVAKKFCTTEEAIRELNHLEDKKIVEGDKILLARG